MEAAAKMFFSSPRFAVVGASQDSQKFGYKGLRWLKVVVVIVNLSLPSATVLAWYLERSLPVQPVTPSRAVITVSSTEYPTVSSPSTLPFPKETSLSIVTQPSITLQILREAKEAGIPYVWLQPGSFDDEGLEYAKTEFVVGIGGKGGMGGEGWCVLVDGDQALHEAREGKL